MKALSIRNPWAWLIAKGLIDIENRTWKTNYRGKLLIHAPKKWADGWRNISNMFSEDQWQSLSDLNKYKLVAQTQMYMGAIIGEVYIVNCVKNHDSIWALEGQWNWVLRNPKLYEKPILNVKGKLSLWEHGESKGNFFCYRCLKEYGDNFSYMRHSGLGKCVARNEVETVF